MIGLSYRANAIQLRDDPADDGEDWIKQIVAATEAPVPMPDWDRYEMVPEILLMDGVEVADRVPLLDSHNRYETEGLVGSAVGLKAVGKELVGRAEFSKAAEKVWTKVREGHLRDLSVGYQVRDKTYVPKETKAVVGGRTFQGPCNVVTKWKVREASVTPIGADDEAKMRGLPAIPDFLKARKERPMLTAEDRATLVGRGMPAELDDAAAVAWSVRNPLKAEPPKTRQADPDDDDDDDGEKPLTARELRAWMASQDKRAEERERKEQARREEKKRIAVAIRAECDRFNIHLDRAREFSDDAEDLAAGLRKVTDYLAERQKETDTGSGHLFGGSLTGGRAQIDKHMGAIGAALIVRAVDGVLSNGREKKITDEERSKALDGHKLADGWQQFRGCGAWDLARLTLDAHGVRTLGMSRPEVAMAVFGSRSALPMGTRAEVGFHVSSSFPNILADAMNKSMLIGYRERAFTWRTVFRQAASVPDFKNINRNRLSEAPNMIIWPENTVPNQIAFADEKETYAVLPYAAEASFGWQSLVNDDMDAISRVPGLMGTAARRTQNTLVWAVVTANPNLQDGQALFSAATGNRKKANTGTGVISVANIGAGRSVMRQQVGVNTKGGNASGAILDLVPAFLVVPSAIETTAEQLINSTYDPASSTFMVANPFRSLTLVVEPLLDATSAAQWYLFSNVADIDTIELSFLQGQEEPVMDSRVDPATWALTYKTVQTFGTKAMDFRGCYRSTGS